MPPYFDALIAGFQRGAGSRCVHLGYWDSSPRPGADRSGDEFARAQQRLDEILRSLAELRDGQSVLDVGCGFGGTLESINQRHADMLLAGVNVDARQLDLCRELRPRPGNRFQWEEADAGDLPFAAGQFERIFCIEAMFHFASRRAFFLEAARVLSPGGVLVCSDITIAASARKLEVPGFCIEAPLQDGYGPWPDFWCDDADHALLSAAAGLQCARELDATANTLPSHRYTAPADADELHDPGDVSQRAALMLRWLHRHGHLRYQCFRFDKPAG